MNKIFKIVFNAARGKMMVVNEATSSVQTGKKAAVTVAVVAALATGSAMATTINTEFNSETLNETRNQVELNAYGGAYWFTGDAKGTISGVTFEGNTANSIGGAFGIGTGANNKIVVENSQFLNNTSKGDGGAIGNYQALEISGSVFNGNKALNSDPSDTTPVGGGAISLGAESNTVVSITGTEFTNNESATNGGAIATRKNKYEDGTNPDLSAATYDIAATFTGNKATKNGGAIYNTFYKNFGNATEGGVRVTGTFSKNEAGNNGGAIFNDGWGTDANEDFTGGKMTVSGNFSENKAAWGGAIFNKGTMTITDSHFEGNQSTSVGGAITTFTATSDTTIDNVVFKNNHSDYDGGAIGNYAALTITNSTFEGNSAQLIDGVVPEDDTAIGGGAIALGAVSSTKVASITGTKFLNNKSGVHGGAIGTRVPGTGIDNVAAKLDIEAYFEGNTALENGGAIHNTFFTDNGLNKGDGVTVKGEFVKNTAKNGGAVYNFGGNTVTNQNGVMTITDSTFTGNTASEKGGAIYNANIMTLVGTNTFTGNTAAEGNDVYNTGTLNIDGTATFEGGIVSTEGAIVNVAENATVSLGGTTDIATLNGSSATLEVTSTTVEIAENNMTETTLVASGSVNDALGGDADALADLVNAADGSLKSVSMVEGQVMGAVTATVQDGKVTGQTVAVNEKTEALAEQVTLAPQMIQRIMMNDVRKRMGDLRAAEGTHGVWARYNGGQMAGSGMEADFSMVQVGIDTVPVVDAPRFGVAFSYAQTEADATNGLATTDMDSFSLAFYGTKMYDNGMFVDVIGRMATMDTEMTVQGNKAEMDNVALSLSGELGWRFDVTDQFFFEPSVEATYTYTNADTFKMGQGTYELESVDSLVGRAGFAAGFKCPANKGDIYVRAAVVHEFMGDSTMNSMVNGRSAKPVESDGEDTYFEYAVGAQFNVNKNTYVYADVERTEGANVDEDWRANVGVRFAF